MVAVGQDWSSVFEEHFWMEGESRLVVEECVGVVVGDVGTREVCRTFMFMGSSIL